MQYDELIGEISDYNEKYWMYNDSLGIYVYRLNVSISIEHDRTYDGREFTSDWTKNFTDESARYHRFLLKYNNSFVKAFPFVAVDGSRMFLPSPSVLDMTITNEEYSIGRIVNEGHSEYDFYINKAKIKIVD